MNSRRALSPSPAPLERFYPSNPEPRPELPLITEDDWRDESPPPPTKPTIPGTPRHPSITADHITPKHPEFAQKIDDSMTSRYQPISVAALQEKLLTGKNLTARQLQNLGNFDDYNSTGDENDMYLPLCRELNAVIKLAKAKAVWKDVAHWSESGNTDHRPDLALYPTHSKAVNAYKLTEQTSDKSTASIGRKDYIARCAYQWMIAAIEVKKEGAESGFGFEPGEPLLRGGEKAVEARAQFSTYAAEIMLRQHRTHLYMFYISGWRARAFRWDRNGALVTHSIDLRTNCKQFLNLIYRLVLADPRIQGFDNTASLASSTEIEKFRLHEPNNIYLEEYKKTVLASVLEHPIYKVECDEVLQPDDHRRTRSSRRKRFLIGKYVAGGYAPIGRATKGWVAYCLDDDVMVFLKEQWRANAIGVHPELETYARLRQYGVQGVATAIAGGDVGGPRDLHKTVSQRYFDKQGFDIPERIQTRLVLKEVGRPLETYGDSIDLIVVTTHAFIGHRQAWEKASILHRDVSVGNILIDTASAPGNPRGFLNDWDLCKYKDELRNQVAPSQPMVSGTWAFASALSLIYPGRPKELSDDLESFVYIPTYCAFRYHKHNLSSTKLDILKNATPEKQAEENHARVKFTMAKHTFFYEEERHENGLYSGGDAKLEKIRSGIPPIQLVEGNSGPSPLAQLLERSYKLLKHHYRSVDLTELDKYKADRPQPAMNAASQPLQRATNAPHVRDPYNIISAPDPDDYNTLGPAPWSPASASSSGSRYADADGSPTRLLDDHVALARVFRSVLTDHENRRLDLTPFLGDKYYDQFDNNPVVIQGKISNPSNSGGQEANLPKSKKRKYDESDPDPDLRPPHRPKKARGHGYQITFRSAQGREQGDSTGEGSGE